MAASHSPLLLKATLWMTAGVTPRASWKTWTAVARGMPSLPGLVGQILQGRAEGVHLPGVSL